MMPISYACGVLASLSNPDSEVKHSDKTIMCAIETAMMDDGKNVRKSELWNATKYLLRKVRQMEDGGLDG